MSDSPQMNVIRFATPEGQDAPSREHPADIRVVQEPVPQPGPGEVLIKVAAAGINQADVHQRAGAYPPPKGASDIPGLEVSGTVEAVGADAGAWEFETPVVALLAGGGYSEYVAVDARQVLPAPRSGLSLIEAGGIIEVAATVWVNVFMHGRAQAGDNLLIHGGTGGIGAFAIQLAKARGLNPIATAGSDEKVAATEARGAQAINYRTENFAERVMELTDGHGADIILDTVGGSYVEDNLRAAAYGARIVSIGTQGGAKGTLNVMRMMAKNAWFTGSMLRPRTGEEKGEILAEVYRNVWPLYEDGTLDAGVSDTFALADAEQAYERFADPTRHGKIVLTP